MYTNESKHTDTAYNVEINSDSGFCFGVVKAIQAAEKQLAEGQKLFCVGDIVHNKQEVNRLQQLGLEVVAKEDIKKLTNKNIIFRAHGEPKSSYDLVQAGNNNLIDATCPVVLKLQQRIKRLAESGGVQILIYGKCNHPEVVGLLDQTLGKGVCVQSEEDLKQVDFSKPIEIFSQTTKSLQGYRQIVEMVKQQAKSGVNVHDTICKQVASRANKMANFARNKDVVFFVGGGSSSNAKVLFNTCKNVNENCYFIESEKDVDANLFIGKYNIGICGATSTPQWLMKKVKQTIENELKERLDTNTENYG